MLEQVLGQIDYNVLSTLKLNGFERNEIITETWLRAYRAPFPTPAHAVGGIGWAKGFATGAHRFETPDPARKAELAKKQALAIWGEADRTLHSQHFLPLFSQAFPNGRLRSLPGVRPLQPGGCARRGHATRGGLRGGEMRSARLFLLHVDTSRRFQELIAIG